MTQDPTWLACLLEDFIRSQELNEIFINGSSSLISDFGSLRTTHPSPFNSNFEMIDSLQSFAFARQIRLDPMLPHAGGTLQAGGFRWQAGIPPLTPDRPIFALRRHRFRSLTLDDFELPAPKIREMESALKDQRPIVISGPTGSGKSSLLSAILSEFCAHERIAILESIPEIELASPLWIRLCEHAANREGLGYLSIAQAFTTALRFKPDRFVIGEIRGSEASTFIDAANCGHGSVLTTLHAQNEQTVRERLKWHTKPHQDLDLFVIILQRRDYFLPNTSETMRLKI